jgi:hypothetical protein
MIRTWSTMFKRSNWIAICYIYSTEFDLNHIRFTKEWCDVVGKCWDTTMLYDNCRVSWHTGVFVSYKNRGTLVIRFFHIVKYFKIAHFISRLQNLCFHIFHNDKAAQNHCTLHVIRKFIYVLLMVLFALKLKNKWWHW